VIVGKADLDDRSCCVVCLTEEFTLSTPLLPRIANGDIHAIDECIDRYGGLVWSLARRLSPSLADAEDAVQEIFVELWKNAERFREEVTGEATFVAMIARRRLIDRLRKSRRELDAQPLDQVTMEYASPPQTAPIELAEEASRATKCLEKLRSDERNVLELSIYHGLSQSQIAEQIGLALGTVKTHSRRGLVQLRDCMQVSTRHRPKGVKSL
jgi:RNA polymerase sigma-70 factor (ECF subfamily)